MNGLAETCDTIKFLKGFNNSRRCRLKMLFAFDILGFPFTIVMNRSGRERDEKKKPKPHFNHFLNISPNYQSPLTLSLLLCPLAPATTAQMDPYIVYMVIVDTKSYLSFC